jgi:hypothetical protein
VAILREGVGCEWGYKDEVGILPQEGAVASSCFHMKGGEGNGKTIGIEKIKDSERGRRF